MNESLDRAAKARWKQMLRRADQFIDTVGDTNSAYERVLKARLARLFPPECGFRQPSARKRANELDRIPRLVHRGPCWAGQAGIGAADCPQSCNLRDMPWGEFSDRTAYDPGPNSRF